MTQVRGAAIAFGLSLLAVACGKTQQSAAPFIDDCTNEDCDDGGAGDDASSTAEMSTGSLAGFVSPAVDGGETTGAPGSVACPTTALFPSARALVPPDVPTCCSNGFEIGDPTKGSTYVLHSSSAEGAAAITLDLDFASYAEADRVVVTASGVTAPTATLFDSCVLKTWSETDTTGGKVRPPDVSIRQFHVDVPAGTTTLTFDFTGVVSPAYIRALGLCDFDVVAGKQDVTWRAVAPDDDGGLCASSSVDGGADAGDAGVQGDGSTSIR